MIERSPTVTRLTQSAERFARAAKAAETFFGNTLNPDQVTDLFSQLQLSEHPEELDALIVAMNNTQIPPAANLECRYTVFLSLLFTHVIFVPHGINLGRFLAHAQRLAQNPDHTSRPIDDAALREKIVPVNRTLEIMSDFAKEASRIIGTSVPPGETQAATRRAAMEVNLQIHLSESLEDGPPVDYFIETAMVAMTRYVHGAKAIIVENVPDKSQQHAPLKKLDELAAEALGKMQAIRSAL